MDLCQPWNSIFMFPRDEGSIPMQYLNLSTVNLSWTLVNGVWLGINLTFNNIRESRDNTFDLQSFYPFIKIQRRKAIRTFFPIISADRDAVSTSPNTCPPIYLQFLFRSSASSSSRGFKRLRSECGELCRFIALERGKCRPKLPYAETSSCVRTLPITEKP